MSDNKGPRRPDTVRLQRISKAFWESAALMSAVELDVFTAISEGHNSIPAAAAALGLEAINVERLFTALNAMQLIHLEGGQYSNAPDVERFLVKGKQTYAGPWMLFGKPRWDSWGSLTEHLRVKEEDQKRLGMYDDTFTVERARAYHEATYSIGMGAGNKCSRDS